MAFDSLVIGDLFELMGGGAQSDIPALVSSAGAGVKFQVLAPSSSTSAALGASMAWDLGAPQPTTAQVQSLLLDGERPFGARASNRTITLPVKITAPDQVTLTAAKELLIQAVDQPAWTLTWTPASTGLSQVLDCFRALPTVLSWGFLPGQPVPIAVITLSFQALPYGRSAPDALTDVAFASPVLGGVAAPPAPVVLDTFSTVSGTNWSQSSSQFVTGPKSARYTPPSSAYLFPSYSKSGLSLSISGLTTLSVWFGQSYDTAFWGHPAATWKSNVTLRWTLTDNASHTISFHRTVNAVPWSNTASTPKWTRITAAIPQGVANFNYTAVTAYRVSLSNYVKNGQSAFVRMNAWLDHVVANPPSLASPASARGVVYNVMGVPGTARTPVSAQFQLPQSGPVSTELSGSGVWWPPVGVTSVKAECIGGGGSGGTRTTSGQGGGGGGGEYAAEPALTVAAGTPVPYSCGTGGQPGAAQQVITFTAAGNGSWVCPSGVTAVAAECWGSGARGADGGGGGGGGEYAAEPALAVTAGKTYAFYIGRGGYFTPGTAATANGQTTTFAGDSVTVTAHGGKIPSSGSTPGGAGGTGSSNTTHFNGGAGGTSPSYGGGGGGAAAWSAYAGNTGGAGAGSTGGAGGAVFNWGFEAGFGVTGWNATTNCTIATSAVQAHSGTVSMLMSSVASGSMAASYGSGTSNGLQVTGSQQYALSGWFRAVASARSCAMQVNWYDSTGTYISTTTTSTATDSTSAWTQVSATVTSPSNAVWGNPLPQVISTGGASEGHYVDDVIFAVAGSGGAGASNPGFPVAGSAPGGGGGGGYGSLGNNPGASGGNGQVRLTFTVASGNPVSGASTTFGSAISTGGTIVTAHGGSAAALNSTTGAAGGTGSTNTTHFNGGAGGLGSTNGGGGGGSGGSASVGNAGTSGASGGAGAQAVAGGGKGANGGTATVGPGDGASPPGGGGGGAVTTGTAQAGGIGGNGNIVLTWTPPLAPFQTLIAHRPGPASPPELNPCVPIGNTSDTPSGTQYTVPSLVSGVNALFNGTYTVVLVNYSWDSPTMARSVTVTVNQFEYLGGHNYPSSVTRAFTPATDVVNGIVVMGELTLPVKDVDPSATSGYFTVSITDTDQSDQFLDVLFLDTQGSTVIINVPPGTSYTNFFIDEPTLDRDLGRVLGSDLDRSQAVSVLDNAIVSGSPFYIVPGDNLFLAYAVEGAPNLALNYLNRWYLERLV